MSNNPEKFIVDKVPLAETNLIEASAGTGKTYSIGILVLRLILEKNIPIQQVLMVTFTKSAVAELEDRIRLFIRMANNFNEGLAIEDEIIKEIVFIAVQNNGKPTVQQLLKNALLFLDETSVLTIHSFCQQTLTTFAFETNQLFGAETLQNTTSIILEEVNEFWRRYITTLPQHLLHVLIQKGLSRKNITEIVKNHLDGKWYTSYNSSKDYTLMEDDNLMMLSEILQSENQCKSIMQQVVQQFVEQKDTIISDCSKNSYAVKNLLPLIHEPQNFLEQVWNFRDKKYVQKLFEHSFIPLLKVWDEANAQFDNLLYNIQQRIILFAVDTITKGVEEYKLLNNHLSFDDMIVNLHKALVIQNNQQLLAGLQNKYKAVFIDEFQDTDRLQYEIFEKAFGSNTILFYIGDPKQSIYAWRKADIYTYFKAVNKVDHVYHMNHNYRSTKKLIEAMNLFFMPSEGFDTFYFKENENAIQYISVESPPINSNGVIMYNDEEAIPISIITCNNKPEIAESVANLVAEILFSKKYTIRKGDEQNITPGDIGILVRSNDDAKIIKGVLDKRAIPSVTINDSKILLSDEAKYILYLLQAFNDSTIPNINRALLTPFTGFTSNELLHVNYNLHLTQFRKYKAIWTDEGIYAALQLFIAEYDVRTILLNSTESGERMITNLFQLIELLHAIQVNKNFSHAELIGWLQRGIEGMEIEGDQYEIRIESDENAVKIVTIHKSKGLDYKIVVAPFLDFQVGKSNHPYIFYRQEESGNYITVEKDYISPEQKLMYEMQAEQENRRLLYVTLTRARYKCFIFKNSYFKNSTLSLFLDELEKNNSASKPLLIDFIAPPVDAGYRGSQPDWKPAFATSTVHFDLLQKNWSKVSYTSLAAKGETGERRSSNYILEPYENFIFYKLARGIKTGNMLHYLFENIDFSSDTYWAIYTANAIKKYLPAQHNDMESMLQLLVKHVTGSVIPCGNHSFMLNQITPDKKLAELEFDFNVDLFNPGSLSDLINDEIPVSIKYNDQLEGIMNGKVDLFFEHKNKYYILDWKSNYLGDNVQCYSQDKLFHVMTENNYHLQYLIYTVALKMYLETRLPDFNYENQFGGVIYIFIRGVRENSANGVFFTKPTQNLIQKIESMLRTDVKQ